MAAISPREAPTAAFRDTRREAAHAPDIGQGAICRRDVASRRKSSHRHRLGAEFAPIRRRRSVGRAHAAIFSVPIYRSVYRHRADVRPDAGTEYCLRRLFTPRRRARIPHAASPTMARAEEAADVDAMPTIGCRRHQMSLIISRVIISASGQEKLLQNCRAWLRNLVAHVGFSLDGKVRNAQRLISHDQLVESGYSLFAHRTVAESTKSAAHRERHKTVIGRTISVITAGHTRRMLR